MNDKNKQQENLRDRKGGTYGAIGCEKEDDGNSPEGFEHRKGPLGPTNGRREGNA
jgi:hypothetical protein